MNIELYSGLGIGVIIGIGMMMLYYKGHFDRYNRGLADQFEAHGKEWETVGEDFTKAGKTRIAAICEGRAVQCKAYVEAFRK